MEIKKIEAYDEAAIPALYASMGWTAYTDDPEALRQGIGSKLLRAVLEAYAHVRQVQLATDNTPKTIAFYQSMGLREYSEIGCCGFMRV